MHTSGTSSELKTGFHVIPSALENAANYHGWMYRQLRPYLVPPVLEIGSGYGTLSRFLLNDFPDSVLSDIDPKVVSFLQSTMPISNDRVRCGNILDPVFRASLDGFGFRSVIALNVLEHIEDDKNFLKVMHEFMPHGGRVCLLVPAHPFLFGQIDRLAGHYRRYTPKTLRTAMEAAGISVQHIWQMNMLGVIASLINKFIPHAHLSTPCINTQLQICDRFVAPLAERIERRLPFPFGLSLLGVGEFKERQRPAAS